ncbi:GPI transamidase component PIG-S [Solenopsis invicta]|uniref:GPI transamidase component PIG-S n=1 Tax=Solenopsis invicta TaxID=13686 RepID=UPI00193EBF70|nr:GPI transamidase component PIG-S [Solenopsis invicta]XP_011164890.2 GPI transamidase component PIG-S [Solenopsis invicta]XP_039303340.1 GPI transamidase component PIG-S [Solenopsis invicta]XP_039303341.1 GPI transamidase component PIG-S [Solenopsis invicta]XP_039303342.1 GPI transamidase component PIG-S [Solenopsis invicta]
MEKIESIDHDFNIDEKYRVYASVSFAVLLLGIGVPLWWQTTTVPRVTLPYTGIDELSQLDIKITTKITIAALSHNRAELLAHEIKRTFANAEIYQLNVEYQVISNNLLASVFVYHELEKVAATFDLDVGNLLLLEATNLNDAVLVGSNRTLYFSTETSIATLIQVLSEWILHDKSLALTKNALAEPTMYSLDEENRRRFPASPAYDVLITLVNPDPQKLKIDWNLKTVTEEYMQPFLDELSILSNFSVKSQWLYLLPLDMNPRRVPDSSPSRRHFALRESVLPQLVTPLEKKLASQVSLHPCINLVVYMVPCDSAPLHIYTRSGHRSRTDSNVEAFLSPRWGGVVLINPPSEICDNAREDEAVTVIPEETAIVGTFLAQLRLLLGIPEMKSINGATAVPLVGLKSRDWEIDSLLRFRTVEQLTSAKLTLQSLARLLKEISNIVITDIVGNRINTALDLVHESAEHLRRGDLERSFILSKEAFIISEAAFSDPTLLALLYFPEDQKYAVYIPLFLPAMIPVLLSLKNIRRYYFPGKNSTEKKADHRESKNNEDNKLKVE